MILFLKSLAGDFGSDVSFQSDAFGGEIETRRAIDAIAIEQSHGRHVVFGTCGDQVFGQSGAFEKAESGSGVELDIHRQPVLSCQFSLNTYSPQNHRDTERTRWECLCESCDPKTEN